MSECSRRGYEGMMQRGGREREREGGGRRRRRRRRTLREWVLGEGSVWSSGEWRQAKCLSIALSRTAEQQLRAEGPTDKCFSNDVEVE